MERGPEVPQGWRAVAPFFLANVLFSAGLFAHALLYNFYLAELGFGEAVMGGAAAAITAGGLTALAPAGLTLDRLGARLTFLASAAVAAAGLALGAFVTTQLTVYGAAFLAGAGTAGWRVSQGPVLMAVAPPGIRSRAFSWNVGLLLTVGAAWTAVAGGVPARAEALLGVGHLAGLQVALVAGAVGTLLAAVAFLAVPRRSPGVGPKAPVAGGGDERPGPLWARLAVPPRIRWLVLLIFLWMCGAALVLPFFNIYFQRVHGLSVDRIGALFAGVQLLSAVAVFGGGELAQRVGPARAFTAWAFALPVALAGMAWAALPALAMALYAAQGVVPPATNPLLDELVLDEADPAIHGAASSWRNGATELSGLVGATLGGALLQAASFQVLFAVAAGVALLGGGGLVRAVRRT